MLKFVLLVLAGSSCAWAKFSWSECGPKDAPIKVDSLSLSPDPIMWGKNITISADVSVGEDISPTAMDIVIEKKVVIWIKVPCENNFGSCTYDDFCTIITNKTAIMCQIFTAIDIPCECPIKAGRYRVPDRQFGPLEKPEDYPAWMADGDYRIGMRIMGSDADLGCVEVPPPSVPSSFTHS